MKKITTILLTGLFFCSCTHYYYVPNIQNVPLFREKNEFRFSASVGLGEESECTEIQAASSITNNIGLMLSFIRAGGRYGDSQAKGTYFDGAVGYYKPLWEHGVFEVYGGCGYSTQNHIYGFNDGVFEVFGGYGYSTQNHIYGFNDGTSDLSFSKLYIQPSLGLTFSLLDLAFSARLSRLSFGDVNKYSIPPYLDINDLNSIANKDFFILEPALTYRIGWKNVKLQSQLQYSWKSNHNPDLPFEHWHLGFGLYFTILAGRFVTFFIILIFRT